MLVTRRRRSCTTILIFGGIGTKEAIFASTASTKPTATGRVGEAEKAKYNCIITVPVVPTACLRVQYTKYASTRSVYQPLIY